MAQLFSTGPAHVYISDISGLASPSNALYLGTAEEAPVIEIIPKYEGVLNDIGGHTPFDVSYQGEMAQTGILLTRWNELTYDFLSSRPVPGAIHGLNGPLDVGSLILTEGLQLGLWVVFSFSLKTAMAAGGMPFGYFFPATIPVGPDKFEKLGTKPRKINLLFWHLRLWDVATGNFLLYTHNVLGLPPIN
jgi:hypothetical protein